MAEEHEDILDILVNEAVSATELLDKSGESESEESPKSNKREREDDEDEESEAKRICTEAEAETAEVDLSQYTPKEQERIKMQWDLLLIGPLLKFWVINITSQVWSNLETWK